MAEARLKVIFAGPHVSVQDGGRPGSMRFGVPASGAMDRKAFRIANAALGNPPGAAGIEVSLGGLTLECLAGPVTLAVAGGGFILQVGARKLGSWQVLTLQSGERLVLRPGPWGSWAYLAFAGQMQSAQWLGSAATHGPSGFGGGRLAAGQEIVIGGTDRTRLADRAVPCPVWARPRHALHVVPGPQDRFFDADTMETLLTARFDVTDAYDRMGLRLRGPALIPQGALAIPSEAILRGSIQVSGDGVATVLLADHQTTGGYPKIATILADDLDGFVQLRPRDAVAFRAVSPAQAVHLARQRAQAFARYLDQLAGGL